MDKELSNKQYNIIMGLILLWGVIINTILVTFFQNILTKYNSMIVVFSFLIITIIGFYLIKRPNNSMINFVGYNLIVLAVSIILGTFVVQHFFFSVIQTFALITSIILFMIVISTIQSDTVELIGTILFIGLLIIIISMLFIQFIGKISAPPWQDWLIAILFCGYTFYDCIIAQSKQKLLHNAINSAAILFLDFLIICSIIM